MKKLFYLFLIVGLAITSCNKPAEIPLEQDVILKATTAPLGGFKSDIVCTNPVAHYALIQIDDGDIMSVDVFYLDGVIYTNTLKLTPGDHVVNMFVLKNDNGTPGDTTDDIEVFATPLEGADYANFVNDALPMTFTTGAFLKNEVAIEVLCFQPTTITEFGFSWFTIDQLIVREFAFFGDICTKFYAQYEANEFYGAQNGGLGLNHDMVAIFKIDVYVNDNFLISYNNEAWLGEGAPLYVQYPDYVGSVDEFDFVLSILVKEGTSFVYKEFHTWSTTDDGVLANIGDDNVMDFVLGSCVPDADLILAPYMDLPASVTMTTGNSTPGSMGTYFDVTLSGIGAGYDIQNGVWGVYCADKNTTISLSTTYTMDVYTSLYPALLPGAFAVQKPVLDNINWLGNNLYRYDGHTWVDVQDAVWLMLGQISSSSTPFGQLMADNAMAYGDGYMPPVGGWAAVLFVDPTADDVNKVLQLLFTLVDP